ncbi:MAG: hypothetical protein JOY69_09355, partial [Candidatus Eremiobacteraeota bacterium]|nr:hypothetical protein [Candidatus Eremiobacteraeota bacterium]
MMEPKRFRIVIPALFAAALALTACHGGGAPGNSMLPAASLQALPGGIEGILPNGAHKIKHVIIIVQENRSFNNLFHGYPGAKTADSGQNSKGQTIQLKPYTLATTWDIQHNAQGDILACNGTGSIPGTNCRMNGFNRETCDNYMQCPKTAGVPIMYTYVPQSQIQPYWDMANQYVLADEMYASNFDASSFVSHQYIIAGASNKAVNYPLN